MMNYSSLEMADTHFIYGHDNAEQARSINHQRHLSWALPDSQTFSSLPLRLLETGSVQKGQLK